MDPFSFCVAILLLKQFDGLFDRNVVRFGVVSYLVVVSFRNIHCDDVPVLLLLVKSFLVFRLENIPAFVFELFIEAWVFFGLWSVRSYKSIFLLFFAIIIIVDFLLLVFFLIWILVFLFDFGFLFEPIKSAALEFLLLKYSQVSLIKFWLLLSHFSQFLFLFLSLLFGLFLSAIWAIIPPSRYIVFVLDLIFVSDEIIEFPIFFVQFSIWFRVGISLWIALFVVLFFLLLSHFRKFIIFLYAN